MLQTESCLLQYLGLGTVPYCYVVSVLLFFYRDKTYFSPFDSKKSGLNSASVHDNLLPRIT